MVHQEHIAPYIQVLCGHQVGGFCVFVLDDLGGASEIKVFKGNFLPELAVDGLGELDSVELGLVELKPHGKVLICLRLHLVVYFYQSPLLPQ